MPGITDHTRQYTSTVYTPFHFYSGLNRPSDTLEEAPMIDFSLSESPASNELLILAFDQANVDKTDSAAYTSGGSSINIEIWAFMPMEYVASASDVSANNTIIENKYPNWVKTGIVTVSEGEIASISPLFSTFYKLVCPSTLTLNIAKNDVNIATNSPYVQQTWPRVFWSDAVSGNNVINYTSDKSPLDESTPYIG